LYCHQLNLAIKPYRLHQMLNYDVTIYLLKLFSAQSLLKK
jgi:hypothetical protein